MSPHAPTRGLSPSELRAELAGEVAYHLIAAAESTDVRLLAAPDPIRRLDALRIDAGLPPVISTAEADLWPESARALLAWAVLRAYAHREEAYRELQDALDLAYAAGCETAGTLVLAMGAADA